MRITCVMCLFLICTVVACVPSPTPPLEAQPTPAPPAPTPTALPSVISEPIGDYVPSDIPRCNGVKSLGHALDFQWEGVDAVGDAQWFYYHCDLNPEDLAAYYRPKMTAAPYEWGEINWVIRPAGTLGVYFHTVRQTWSYLWFLPAEASTPGSYLVVAEAGTEPLDLPCCK